MRFLPLALRDIAQQYRVDALLAHRDLADRSFRGKFVPILMPSKNPRALTYQPCGLRICAKFANVLGVGTPKPLGQQEVEGLS